MPIFSTSVAISCQTWACCTFVITFITIWIRWIRIKTDGTITLRGSFSIIPNTINARIGRTSTSSAIEVTFWAPEILCIWKKSIWTVTSWSYSIFFTCKTINIRSFTSLTFEITRWTYFYPCIISFLWASTFGWKRSITGAINTVRWTRIAFDTLYFALLTIRNSYTNSIRRTITICPNSIVCTITVGRKSMSRSPYTVYAVGCWSLTCFTLGATFGTQFNAIIKKSIIANTFFSNRSNLSIVSVHWRITS